MIQSVEARRSLLEVMLMAYRDATGLDIRLQVNDVAADFIFTLKDERTLNRVAYVKVPFIEAGEMMGDPELFDRKLRELILQANMECDHTEIEQKDEEGYWLICTKCETLMEPVGDSMEEFKVREEW